VAPSRIYLIGFMGAGKTTIGRRLAKKLGWKFVDLDQEIERREHRTIAEIFRSDGEPRFRQLEQLCLQQLATSRKAVIALGGGAFINEQNRELALKTGLTVWLKLPFSRVAERVKIDGTRPKFNGTQEVEQLYRAREPLYALAKVHVSTDEGTPESAADEIIGALRNL
jgi:shikimate kinase